MGKLEGKVVEVRASSLDEQSLRIGEALKEIRKLSGLTQVEMAELLNIGQASISKFEKGRADMQLCTIQKYVEALGGTLQVSAAFDAGSSLCLRVREAFDVELDQEDQLVLPIFAEEQFRPHRDVVLSIRPKFSSRIMSGEKTVELRRKFPAAAPEGTIAYIYSTSPERAMVGVAEISSVRKLPIDEIWRRYADVAFIERPEFDRYFEGLHEGFALEFANVRPFETPLGLAYLRERFGFEPPQSFLYAKRDLRKALKNEHAVVSH
ncbi:putative transcriptional regulator/plasmid maintenance system antidote protein VapI [Rhodovulum sulfidophilum]|uniref:helix-turn-helix domain-containing protein n=1 Tax=Rhodovulum sulfidophilum TaxID=35806 RepID=UPI0005A60963|nr:helix-turn-helix domain-containing protein [Rhodovulum sulfidophilum]ANB32609.1 Cro/Cl family transcriptional regulator [Rhodovulum sulfidophilum DSM 1374]ANB36460.1 Cro/Cl family transcriptional regulator [Rhodovulum sulfidophilum]MCW2305403.1 putative transcriptional regulator/plasmid maintenance system antidote protein VapI [Rhodovulum sulfidophilum]